MSIRVVILRVVIRAEAIPIMLPPEVTAMAVTAAITAGHTPLPTVDIIPPDIHHPTPPSPRRPP